MTSPHCGQLLYLQPTQPPLGGIPPPVSHSDCHKQPGRGVFRHSPTGPKAWNLIPKYTTDFEGVHLTAWRCGLDRWALHCGMGHGATRVGERHHSPMVDHIRRISGAQCIRTFSSRLTNMIHPRTLPSHVPVLLSDGYWGSCVLSSSRGSGTFLAASKYLPRSLPR